MKWLVSVQTTEMLLGFDKSEDKDETFAGMRVDSYVCVEATSPPEAFSKAIAGDFVFPSQRWFDEAMNGTLQVYWVRPLSERRSRTFLAFRPVAVTRDGEVVLESQEFLQINHTITVS